jgi:hypothetical protein
MEIAVPLKFTSLIVAAMGSILIPITPAAAFMRLRYTIM